MEINEKNLSWDADEWIKKFENAKRTAGGTRPVRAEVFKNTLNIVKQKEYLSSNGTKVKLDKFWNENPLKDNVFCEREIRLRNPEHKYDTMVKVFNADCLAHAKVLLEQDSTPDVCVLNMASSLRPGGGVKGGAGAQEEYLFRCSDYLRFLFQYADPADFDCEQEYGIPRNSRHHYPLKRDFGGVFSCGVTVFRDTEAHGYMLLDTPWQVNFIAVPACNISRFNGIVPNWFESSTKNRIRAILRIAYKNKQRRLVLGAFGCGAFHNPPELVAKLFKQVLEEPEFQGLFKEIHFAIIEDHNSHGRNFNAFNSVLNYTQNCESKDSEPSDKETIENLLHSTGRVGVENVIENLQKGGFFTAPASKKRHNNFNGGLAKHSLDVYQIAMRHYQELKSSGKECSFDENSVTLCSILHDVCKMDEYIIVNGKPKHTGAYYQNKNNIKLHGIKSVDLLTKWGLELTDQEKEAIHWHMGGHALDASNLYHCSYYDASLRSPLVCLIHEADSVSADK